MTVALDEVLTMIVHRLPVPVYKFLTGCMHLSMSQRADASALLGDDWMCTADRLLNSHAGPNAWKADKKEIEDFAAAVAAGRKTGAPPTQSSWWHHTNDVRQSCVPVACTCAHAGTGAHTCTSTNDR